MRRSEQPVPGPVGLVRSLLRFPLFYKILVANAVIVVITGIGSGIVARATAAHEVRNFVLVLVLGLILSVISNAIILRLALSPLDRLEETAIRVQSGDASARVAPSHFADRNMERLAGTFNMMLGSVESYRSRLRDVAARALNAQEEERKRISRELHDGIAQTLAALRVHMRVARTADDDARAELLDRVSAGIGGAAEEVRRIAQGLRPPALDMLGLSPAIESCARGIAETSGVLIETDIVATEGLLSKEAELALYRIVQEALSNVARHSGARTARVDLRLVDGTIEAVVSDTGHGFDVGERLSHGGLGLFGMQERGAYVGGAVQIESEPGHGTRVRVTIPAAETARHV